MDFLNIVFVTFSMNFGQILDKILKQQPKTIYISGNGAAGKSTLAKRLLDELIQHGIKAVHIDTDNFLLDSSQRKERGLTSCHKESYDFSNINFDKNFDITIIEGIGAAFLNDSDKNFGIFITLPLNQEIERRLKRNRNRESNLSKTELHEKYTLRRKQFNKDILPLAKNFRFKIASYSIIKQNAKETV